MLEVTEGSYYGASCKAAGHILLKPTGTTGESLHAQAPEWTSYDVVESTPLSTRVHGRQARRRPPAHGYKGKKPGVAGPDKAWVRNLETAPVEDELAALRARGTELAPGVDGSREVGVKEAVEAEKDRERSRKKDNRKKKNRWQQEEEELELELNLKRKRAVGWQETEGSFHKVSRRPVPRNGVRSERKCEAARFEERPQCLTRSSL